MLRLKGVCAVALLLQCGEAYLIGNFIQKKLNWPSTGFSKAIRENFFLWVAVH